MNGPFSGGARAALCESFMRLESWTWYSLRDSDQFNLALGEESITDFALLELRRRNPESVFVRKFTRRQERSTGADWEWWFTDDVEWFGMRVQAKRLSPTSARYESLGRAAPPNRTRQSNALIRTATAQRPPLYPAYCFYNWVPSALPDQRVCQCTTGAEALGITIADAYAVKQVILHRSNHYDNVSQVARPIHCLVCCPVHPDSSVANAARDKVVDLRGLETLDGMRPTPVPDPTTEPPDYVRHTVGWQAHHTEAVLPRPGLAGVVVMRIPKNGAR